MRKTTFLIALICLLVLFAVPVYADGIPPLPHAFYGDVTINGSPAPTGTRVEARGTGVITGVEDNPTITAQTGVYGTSNPFEHRLLVQGNIDEGATITFYVNGTSTGQTAEWHSSEVTELDLSVTIVAPPPGPAPGPAVPPPPPAIIKTTLFGKAIDFPISETGVILRTIEVISPDGLLTMTIPKGTIALDKNGNPLSTLYVDIEPSAHSPPEDSRIIGLTYDFGPPGATFDPPITFTWKYNPDELLEDVAEGDLVVAFFNEDTGKWDEVPSKVNTAANRITAEISHFTQFALIGALKPAAFKFDWLVISPTTVVPDMEVTVRLSVANVGVKRGETTVVLKINGVKEAEKRVTVDAGSSQLVDFTVSRKEPGTYNVEVNGLKGSFTVVTPPAAVVPARPEAPPKPPTPPAPAPAPAPTVPPTAPPTNWALIVGIIAAIVIAGLLLYFLFRRRAY